MILPIRYQVQVLQMLHDGQGHHGMERTIAMCREHLYWNTLYKDVVEYVKNSPQCQVTRGQYVSPKTKPGSIIGQLTISFPNFSQVFVTSNQKGI